MKPWPVDFDRFQNKYWYLIKFVPAILELRLIKEIISNGFKRLIYLPAYLGLHL